MAKQKPIETEGKIVKCLPNAKFRVKLENTDKVVLGYASGKMQQNFIKMVEGDNVKIELSPYDLEKGRITERIDEE